MYTYIYPGIQRINTDICNITIEPSLKYANKNVNRYINKVYVSTKKKKNEVYGYKYMV